MAYYTILTPEITGEGLDGVDIGQLIDLLKQAKDQEGRPCFGQVTGAIGQSGVVVEVLGEDAGQTNGNTSKMNELIKQFRS